MYLLGKSCDCCLTYLFVHTKYESIDRKIDKLLSFRIGFRNERTHCADDKVMEFCVQQFYFLMCFIHLFVLTLDEYCCNSIIIRQYVNDKNNKNDVQLQSLWFGCVFYSYTSYTHLLLLLSIKKPIWTFQFT